MKVSTKLKRSLKLLLLIGILAAIVDLSPVGRGLPLNIREHLENLRIPSFRQVRELPAWGSIFSPYVQFIRPESRKEEELFLQLVGDYLKALISSLILIRPDEPHSASTIERHKNQHFYCLQQKRNDKTRRVLEKAFNSQWAQRYMDMLLLRILLRKC